MKTRHLLYSVIAAGLFCSTGCSNESADESIKTVQQQKITIHATSRLESTRATYTENEVNNQLSLNYTWDLSDQLNLFATDTPGTFQCAKVNSPNDASFSGSFGTALTSVTDIYGCVSASGVAADKDKISVDLSVQDGSLADAARHTVIYGKGTFDPADADNPVDMKFEQHMTMLKFVLRFPVEEAGTTAQLSFQADGLYNSVVLATPDGSELSKAEGRITVPAATVSDHQAAVFISVYPSAISNLTVYATIGDNVYTYTNKPSTTLLPNKVYRLTRDMAKVEDAGVAAAYDGGTGTSDDPYLIANAAQLRKLQADVQDSVTGKNYKLTQDIYLSGAWTPIGSNASQYKGGSFDGAGHTISGNIVVSAVAQANDGVGVFGTVSNVKFQNLKVAADITSTATSNFTGGVVGNMLYQGAIVNCQYSGTIRSASQYIGGIIGQAYVTGATANQQCLIEGCTNTGSIESQFATDSYAGIGGIMGRAAVGAAAVPTVLMRGCRSVSRSIAYKNTATSKYFAGGLCGDVNNSVAAGNVQFVGSWCATKTLTADGRALSVCSGANAYFKATSVFAQGLTGVNLFRSSTMPNVVSADCAAFAGTRAYPYGSSIANMNTAWGSSLYQFNQQGEVVSR